jgi:nitrate reductase gamma subunit
MAEYINHLLFGVYPYVAIAIMVIGSILRYDRDQYTWKTSSSQLLADDGMRIGNNLFHIGILLILVGHAVGLLTPTAIYTQFISVETKQLLAMAAGGVFGIVCFVGMVMLIRRRLFNPRIRATSTNADILVLLLIFVQLCLGLLTIPVSAQHLDGSSMLNLSHWAQYIVTLQPGAADFVQHENIVFKLHILTGLTLLVLFPFTRLVHVFSGVVLPVKYLWRSGYQIVRKRA